MLAEYGAEGPLTTTLLAVVGIDDAVSLLLFSITATLVGPMLREGGSMADVSLIEMIEFP